MHDIGLLFPLPVHQADLVVGGIGLLERQARQLRHAGVEKLLLVDPVPLMAVPAGAVMVSSAALADHIAPDDRVIVLAAGLVIDPRAVAAVLAVPAPAMLVSALAGVERIDSQTLAGGVLAVPGALVRRIAAALGEWDLASTLLRATAAEADVTAIDRAAISPYAPAMRRDVPLLWAQPQTPAEARLVTDNIVAAAQKGCLDWPARWLHPWPENLLVRWLAPTRITPNMVTLATGVIGLVALLAFAAGWLWTGLVLALITGPLDGVDGKLARTRIEYSRWGELEHLLDKLLEYGWYLAVAGWFAMTMASALPWAIAALIILPAIAEAVQGEFFRRLTGIQLDDAGPLERRIRLVAGRRNTFLWTWAGFALAGAWFEGFVTMAAYSVVTTGVAQWRFYKRLSAYGRTKGAQIAANYAATGYSFLPRRNL